MLVLYIVSVILQLILVFKQFWKFSTYISLLSLVTFGVPTSYFFFTEINLLHFLELFFAIYLSLNLMRIFVGQSNADYLYKAYKQTLLSLLPVQFLLTINKDVDINFNMKFYLTLVVTIIVVLIFIELTKNLSKLNADNISNTELLNDFPTLTVAIPARNETKELFDCLSSIVASDYPKLEIIVIDDCSQDGTADIIRQFAQSGVRFIAGREPDNTWLPKNQAYEVMLNEASGEYIFYCSADVRLSPDALSKIVSKSVKQNKSMICIEPTQSNTSRLNKLFIPLQSWWELVIPRKIVNRPATSSSSWLVIRKQLLMLGGFKPIARAVFPEKYFAQQFIKGNHYAYSLSSNSLIVESNKSFKQVISKTIRSKYPTYHKKIELSALMSLLYLALLAIPFFTIINGVVSGFAPETYISIVAIILLNLANSMILRRTMRKWSWFYGISFTFSAIVDLLIVNISMLRYEFGNVSWKDRNICLPVMHRVNYSVAAAEDETPRLGT